MTENDQMAFLNKRLEAYREGQNARRGGAIPLLRNPYRRVRGVPEHVGLYSCWEDGWLDEDRTLKGGWNTVQRKEELGGLT